MEASLEDAVRESLAEPSSTKLVRSESILTSEISTFAHLTDLTIFTEDGVRFRGHSIILCSVSEVVRNLLKLTECCDKESCIKPKSELSITLAGVSALGLRSLLTFVYLGQVNLNSESDLEEFEAARKTLLVEAYPDVREEDVLEELPENAFRGQRVRKKDLTDIGLPKENVPPKLPENLAEAILEESPLEAADNLNRKVVLLTSRYCEYDPHNFNREEPPPRPPVHVCSICGAEFGKKTRP